LLEFDRISERGGVLGAMETGYQRGRIQDESMHYEHMKHDGSQPIIGVNMFLSEGDATPAAVELTRGTEDEKQGQICRLEAFHEQHQAVTPAVLGQVQSAALNDENVFESDDRSPLLFAGPDH